MKNILEPDKMTILLAGPYPDETTLFLNAFKGLKLRHSLAIYPNRATLQEYLADEAETPHLIFLDGRISVEDTLQCLRQIREDIRFMETSIAIYADFEGNDTLTAYYSAGANICIRTPETPEALEKIISQVVYLNWQYLTNGLDREKFILKY